MSEVAAAGRTETFATARALIDGAQKIVLTTHVQPDGDGIGSEVALARWLSREGKDVTILNPNPTPRRFRFFEEVAPVEGFESSRAHELISAADLLIVLDISVPGRLGAIEPVVREHEPPILIVDHHAGPSMIPGHDVRDVEASATGEIVYRMLRAWRAEIDAPMATALYAAIAYDTGGFRYANTRATTHEIAADLLRRGVDLPNVHLRLFESMSPVRVRFLAHALSHYELSENGRVAWLVLPRKALEAMGADPEDVDGAAEALRAIEGVDVSIVVREIREGATKVSFRSRGAADVNAFARQFGGGGHRNAAGAFLEEPLDQVVNRIVPAARETFDPGRN